MKPPKAKEAVLRKLEGVAAATDAIRAKMILSWAGGGKMCEVGKKGLEGDGTATEDGDEADEAE
jgi:hypothetical protein